MFYKSSSLLSHSGRQWMEQQARDPFVLEARRRGYIARSAFKLIDINNKFGLFSHQHTQYVVDLGCSPGSWLQVTREYCGEKCVLFGVDILKVSHNITNAICIQGDFTNTLIQQELITRMSHMKATGVVNVILSDMCVNRGSGSTDDRQRQMQLNLEALKFATIQLTSGGHFVCKVLGSPNSFEELKLEAHRWFVKSTLYKPNSSRRGSDESFLVCIGKRREAQPKSYEGELNNKFGLDDWPGMLRKPRHR